MPKRIRVYELARELGMTNTETLELAESLGIGVKSHSSSVVDAQADRVRRKAEREGLIRDEQPKEPKPAKKAAAKKAAAKKAPAKKAAAKKAPAKKAAAEKAPAKKAPAKKAPAKEAAEEPAAEPADADAAEVTPPAEVTATETSAPAPAVEADPDTAAVAATAAPRRVVTSSGSARPIRPAAPAETPPEEVPAQPAARAVAPAPPSIDAPVSTPRPDPASVPLSPSGKPIPPPPGPPTSASGKPIPPPPGRGGRGATATPSGPRGVGRRTSPASPPPPTGAPPPGRGRPGSGPPGRSGPQRQPPRRRKSRRRRRSIEELQPVEMATYTPEDAPVPEGVQVVERASTPQDVGPKLNRTAADVVRFLMQQGEMVTATQSLSDEMIELFAAEIGAEIRLVDPGEEQEVELQKLLAVDSLTATDSNLATRPPVITVMGHVDHGKTKLLDQIRHANVIDDEAGGITQHIGAYQVTRNGHRLTFIDTPGHEAFTAMRARGAQATDVVVLVVAADDGVMPQTEEAISHARAAEVPIVVAINKIDRDNADVNRTMQQLSEHGLVPEAWGGDTVTSEISALNGTGIDELLDSLVLVAELEELQASPEGRASGVVLESHLDVGRGPVATLLVQEGTLTIGDPVVAGAAWGRTRALVDDRGAQVKEAGPSTPVQVLGLSEVARAGDDFVVAPSEKVASRVADTREHWQRQASLGRDAAATAGGAKLEDIFQQIQSGEAATLNLVVKADVNGSLEALTDSLAKLERDEVKVAFVHRGVGAINENDIQLAAASNATLIAFNVRPDRKARQLADAEQVEIRSYEIIYNVLEDIENAIVGLLEPEFEEIVTGEAEVREVFRVPRVGAVAGCYVQSGVITRGSKVRFLREGVVIWKGTINSLRRFKDDVREVQSGFECGIGLSDFQDLKQGDLIETYEDREIPRS